jgi:quercetin dioxygenase-like cupin family protein
MTTNNDTIAVGALHVRFLVEAAESSGTVTVFECSVPGGARTPAPHSHDGFEETIYGLEGVSRWTIGGDTMQIGRGDAVCIPRGTIHAFYNDGEADAKFLAVASPGVFGRAYFNELAALLAGRPGPPDHAAIADVMRRHGLTPAAPAPTAA